MISFSDFIHQLTGTRIRSFDSYIIYPHQTPILSIKVYIPYQNVVDYLAPIARNLHISIVPVDVYDLIGTDVFIFIVLNSCWFWKHKGSYWQVCGKPYRNINTARKNNLGISRYSFLYCDTQWMSAGAFPISLTAQQLLCYIFGLKRHLPDKFKQLIPAAREMLQQSRITASIWIPNVVYIHPAGVAGYLWKYVESRVPRQMYMTSFRRRFIRALVYRFVCKPLRRWRDYYLPVLTDDKHLYYLGTYILHDLCIPWIRSGFYVAQLKGELKYFGKKYWRKMHGEPPERLDSGEFGGIRQKYRVVHGQNGPVRFRLLPKDHLGLEIRPISIIPYSFRTRMILQVLQRILPSGNYDLRNPIDGTDLWSLQMDVKWAYDLVDRGILWDLVESRLRSHAIAEDFVVSFYTINGQYTSVKPTRNSIISPRGTSYRLTVEEIMAELYKLLYDHTFFYQGKIYLQQSGIPQGSILGAHLCSFYLNSVLPRGNYLRYTDDILILGRTLESVKEEAEKLRNCHFVIWNDRKEKIKYFGQDRIWCGIHF